MGDDTTKRTHKKTAKQKLFESKQKKTLGRLKTKLKKEGLNRKETKKLKKLNEKYRKGIAGPYYF